MRQVQKVRETQRREDETPVEAEEATATKEREETITKAMTEKMLDEIDLLLAEVDAEELVANFQQRGGEQNTTYSTWAEC